MRTTAQFAKSGGIALGQFTGGPTRNYAGRVDIRVLGVTARETSEGRLVGPVAPVDVAARGAFPRSIAWIDSQQQNSGENRFVCDKRSKLRERPTVQNCALRFPNRYPVSDSGQFLDRNSSAGAFGCLNDLLADNVIGVRGEPSLTPGKLLKFALGRARLLSLKFSAQSAMPVPDALDGFTAGRNSIRSARDLRHAEINSEKRICLNWRGLSSVTRSGQIKDTTRVDQVGLPALVGEQSELWDSGGESNLQTLAESANRDGLLLDVPSQNTGIVANRPTQTERTLHFLIEFVGICDLRNAADCDLRRQPEFTPQRGVGQRVYAVLSKLLRLPCLLRNPVARLVDSLKRFQQRSGLRWVGEQLHFGGESHCPYYNTETRLLSWLKPEVSGAEAFL